MTTLTTVLVAAGLVLLVLLVVGTLRNKRLRSLLWHAKLHYRPRLKEDCTVVMVPLSEKGQIEGPPRAKLVEDMAIVSGATAAGLFWQMFQIDRDVINAAHYASAVLADGSRAVGDSYIDFIQYAGTGEALFTTGELNRMSGYVGEQIAASEFAAQRSVVELAATSNNPGWDLLLDNVQAVDVKMWQSVGSLNSLANSNPDTMYAVPADINGTITANNVVTLDGFSHEEARESLYGSIDAAENITTGAFVPDALELGVPITLIALTLYREVREIRDGKKIGTAVRDGGLVLVARGGGAMLGMQAGAWAGGQVDLATGGMTMGFGAATGAMAGSIGGSLMGTYAVNWWKNRPLRNANLELEEALGAYGVCFLERDVLERLDSALDAPVMRAKANHEDLAREVARDSRSLKWWVYPSRGQVLRRAALEHAQHDIDLAIRRRDSSIQTFQRVSEGDNAEAIIGMMMANSPSLVAQIGVSEPDLVDAISDLLKEAARAREVLNIAAR